VAAAALGVTLTGVLAVLIYSAILTGRVANEYGEDPQRWQWLMLPFGILGPFLARMILSRWGR
jgi:hypothetical protein